MRTILNWMWVVGMVLCILVMQSPQEAHATSIPGRTVTVTQNSKTGHLYFNPTYPLCVNSPTVKMTFSNSTGQSVNIMLGTETRTYTFVIKSHASTSYTFGITPTTDSQDATVFDLLQQPGNVMLAQGLFFHC